MFERGLNPSSNMNYELRITKLRILNQRGAFREFF